MGTRWNAVWRRIGFFWIKNKEDFPVLYANGPTYSLQPKPKIYSGYHNIAGSAEITATNGLPNSNTEFLNDGLFRLHEFGVVEEFEFERTTTMTLKFPEYRKITALMIYNSYDYAKAFARIERIELSFKVNKTKGIAYLEKLAFDWDLHANIQEQFMRPGGSVVAEFNEIMVDEIRITINAPSGTDVAAISDIVVLGK
jgi:hypothetical protein